MLYVKHVNQLRSDSHSHIKYINPVEIGEILDYKSILLMAELAKLRSERERERELFISPQDTGPPVKPQTWKHHWSFVLLGDIPHFFESSFGDSHQICIMLYYHIKENEIAYYIHDVLL